MSRSVKKWDIDWDAAAALVDFARLEIEEAVVALQMINLMYVQNGAIDNSPEDIKNYVKGMSRARCEKVIHRLINKQAPTTGFFLENGKILHTKVAKILKVREETFNKSKVFGKIGGETASKNKQNQGADDSPPKESVPSSLPSSISSIKTSSSTTPASLGFGRKGFSIWDELTTEGEAKARASAPGWDLRKLAGVFDEKVRSGKFQAPGNPDEAFPAWCAKYTKGKRPG